jgi:glutamine synthetase
MALLLLLSGWTVCSQGVANRGASVRVGRDTEKEGKGYFEDRRPGSNMDPYVVTSMIAETTILCKAGLSNGK